MMTTVFEPEQDLALANRLADTARSVSLPRFRGKLRQWNKADGSIATDADEAVEDALRALVASERPGDAMLGEERGQTGSGRRRWIVDAIDGTHSFAAGLPQWATLIALQVDGDIVVGVCDEPFIGRRHWAVRGGGAFRVAADSAPVRLRVSATRDLSAACAFVPPPEWVRGNSARAAAAALIEVTTPEVAADDHPALLVASGACDVAVFFMGGPWDMAAPSIVVEEAGGRFSDLDGRYDIEGRGAVFSNGYLHERVLRLTAAR